MDDPPANNNSTAGDGGDDYEPLVYGVSGVAAFLAVVVCVLILILCRILYARRRRRKHQINTNGDAFSQGTVLTTLPSTSKGYDAFSNATSDREAITTCNSTVKSDASTTSSNHIRVSDSSGSSGGQIKPEIVTATIEMSNGGTHKRLEGTVSADYAEIEESKSDHEQQKGDTLQSAADSTLSSVESFNSTVRDSTMSYGEDPILDNLEPGAHNTPKFPHRPILTNSSDVDNDYEKDPDYSKAYLEDYERDPNYQKQKRPVVPPSVYQQLQLNHQKVPEMHYRAPEKSLRPLSETVTARALIQHDYADTIPHSNSISTPQPQNYTELRASTLDPLPHYTHLDITTKENTRGSGLSYVTTDL